MNAAWCQDMFALVIAPENGEMRPITRHSLSF
jgi:hypothetical protein